MFHHVAVIGVGGEYGFRPLSWGLFFNWGMLKEVLKSANLFSSPFLGTFFQ